MGKYLIKRLGYLVVTLFLIITLTFIAMKAIPGDPIGAKYEKASQQAKERIAATYGLDKPKTEQYIMYLKNILKGNLGLSIVNPGKTANAIVAESAPASMKLGIISMIVGLTAGGLCGFFAGLRKKGIWDYIVMAIITIGISVPNFVIASLLQYTLTYKIPLLPPIGWEKGWTSGWQYVILPSVALAFSTVAIYAKYMREAVIEVLDEEYILLARAKGLSSETIMRKYVLRNSILPIVTISAQQVAMLLTGSVVIEKVYSIPGIGKYFVNSVIQRDYTVIMAVTIFYSLIYMVSMLVLDILYYKIDPRIRMER